MIKVLYVLSILIVYVLSILLKKKDEKISIITDIIVNLIILSCYNILTSFILSILSININLISLGIVNVVISLVLLFIIIKQKKIQKHYLKIKDVFAIIIIITTCLVVSILNFGFPFEISYLQVDASNHYGMASDFYNNGKIKLGPIPGAYINNGIVFKILFDLFDSFNGYIIFIALEIIKLAFSGILFYLSLCTIIKKKMSYVIAIVLSIIYMVAYPLNGMLCGFVYLQMAINIVNVVIILLMNYKELNRISKLSSLLLLTFGLMFTYYILVPPVYVAIFLFLVKDFKQNKISTLIDTIVIFTLPCLSGIGFYIIPIILGIDSGTQAVSLMTAQSSKDAYTYVSYWSSFIVFIPFVIGNIVKNIKDKKISFSSVLVICNIIYIIVAVILQNNGMIERYYVMKPYYLLWLTVLITAGEYICNIYERNIDALYKIIISFAVLWYAGGLVFSVVQDYCSIKVFDQKDESLSSMYDIYKLNRGVILHENFEKIYTNEELQVLKNLLFEIEDKSKIIYLEDGLNKEWLRRLLLISDEEFEKTSELMYELRKKGGVDTYIVNNEEQVYIVCYKNIFINKYFTQVIDELEEKTNKIESIGKLVIYSNK